MFSLLMIFRSVNRPPIQVQYPVLTYAQELLNRYFVGNPLDVSAIPIQVDCGTEFQKQVWDTIQRIPYGKVRSYKWIAETGRKTKSSSGCWECCWSKSSLYSQPVSSCH